MKILYKQSEEQGNLPMQRLGIQKCFLKKLLLDRDQRVITKKEHHHTGYEIHFIMEGCQEYEVEGRTYMLEEGEFLVIYPKISHTVRSSAAHTRKYSLTFDRQASGGVSEYTGKIPGRIMENLAFVTAEEAYKREISTVLIENSILEILVEILRILGEMKEKEQTNQDTEHAVIALAKQYMNDNIEFAPKVSDVASYCYLSTKHFTRLFVAQQGMTPGEYMRKLRVKTAEKLLLDQTLTLKQISDRMNFANEYYFNAFFKKYAGMTPGAYRKMTGDT